MQPPPVFLPGEFHGQRSLAGCSPQGRIELDMTEDKQLYAFMAHVLRWRGHWGRAARSHGLLPQCPTGPADEGARAGDVAQRSPAASLPRRRAALTADSSQSQQRGMLHLRIPGLLSGCQAALSGASSVVPPQRVENRPHGTSLVAQWLRRCPPAWVRSLVRELRSPVPLSQKMKP